MRADQHERTCLVRPTRMPGRDDPIGYCAAITRLHRHPRMILLFVSYRRVDSKSFAHRLYDRLRRVFGRAA